MSLPLFDEIQQERFVDVVEATHDAVVSSDSTLYMIREQLVELTDTFRQLFEDQTEMLQQAAIGDALKETYGPKVEPANDNTREDNKKFNLPSFDDIMMKIIQGIGRIFTGVVAAISLWTLEIDTWIRAARLDVPFVALARVISSVKNAVLQPFTSLRNALLIVGMELGIAFDKLKGIFRPVSDFFIRIFNWLPSIKTIVGNMGLLGQAIKGAGRFLRFLFGPFTLALFALFDAVSGFIEGYRQGGFWRGLEEAILEVIRGIVTKPLDLVKDMIAWVFDEIFGWEKTAKKMRKFSFTKEFDKAYAYVRKIFGDVVAWFGDVFSGEIPLSQVVGDAVALGRQLINDSVAEVNKQWTSVKTWMSKALSGIVAPLETWFDNIGTKITNAVESFYTKTIEPLVVDLTAITAPIRNVIDSLTTWIVSKIPTWADVKQELGPVVDLVDTIISDITNLMGDVVGWVKDQLGAIGRLFFDDDDDEPTTDDAPRRRPLSRMERKFGRKGTEAEPIVVEVKPSNDNVTPPPPSAAAQNAQMIAGGVISGPQSIVTDASVRQGDYYDQRQTSIVNHYSISKGGPMSLMTDRPTSFGSLQ